MSCAPSRFGRLTQRLAIRAIGHAGAGLLLWQTLAARRRGLIALIVLGGVAAAAVVLPSIVVRRLVDVAVPSADLAQVLWCAAGLAGALILEALLGFALATVRFNLAEGSAHALRDRLYRSYQELPFATFTRTPAGEFIARVINDTTFAQLAVASAIPSLVVDVLSVLVLGVWLGFLDWRLALLSLGMVPVVALVSAVGGRSVHRATTESMEASTEMVNRMSETLDVSGAALVQLTHSGDREVVRFAGVSLRYADRSMQRLRSTALIGALTSAVVAIATGAVLGLGGALVAGGELTFGTLLAFVTVLAQAYLPISSLTNARADLASASANLIRVWEALQWPNRPVAGRSVTLTASTPTTAAPRGAEPLPLHFEQVSLAYGAEVGNGPTGPSVVAVDGVELLVPAGSTVAVVGPSGAGKSSLASLATGLMRPDRGRVLIGGRDVAQIPERERAELLALVTQDTFLFHDTLVANIAYGCLDADEATVRAAAKLAELDTFIDMLPDGYNTVVGQRGFRLSGGERQRVAIARALVRRPAVLVLDEPTSHLDAATEEQVRSSLAAAGQGRTCLLVTHRLSLAADADLVVVMNGGRIVQAGPPADLAAADGPYATLLAMGSVFRDP